MGVLRNLGPWFVGLALAVALRAAVAADDAPPVSERSWRSWPDEGLTRVQAERRLQRMITETRAAPPAERMTLRHCERRRMHKLRLAAAGTAA